jgi:hypothetical protein
VLLHELLHFAGFGENIAYACSHKAIPCAPLNPKYPKNCKCKKDDDHFPPTNPDGDMPDDNFSVASLNASNEIYESHNSDLLILRHGFYREAGALINRFKRGFSYIEPDQSPFEMKDPPPILFIPSGGLYGMEKSSQFKSILEDYVSQGGTLIVFAQQHGHDFSALPSPDELPLECCGWREDQSCRSNSVYVDTWHPALSSAARSLISSPIDGYFASYPSNSTVLLSRRINGMPAMLAYPYGEGRVVVTSMFEDWGNSHGQSTAQGRAIVRDLITWAKNPDLEIPEYNLRDNPDPEVNLNLELKNLSDASASKAKILWLDPGRNLYLEEEKIISIPVGGINIHENCIISETSFFCKPMLMLNKIENELVL